jgi:hypothetical protein
MCWDNKVMPVDISEQASRVVIGKVQTQFQTNPVPRAPECMYDVTSNGQKFVVVTLALDMGSQPVTLVVNWPVLLKKQRQQSCRRASRNGVVKNDGWSIPGSDQK